MGALEFSRSNPSASKGKRINKKAIEKPTENEGRAKNKKNQKKKTQKWASNNKQLCDGNPRL